MREAHAKVNVTKAASVSDRTNSTLFARPLRFHASQLVKIMRIVLMSVMLAARTRTAVKVQPKTKSLRLIAES